MLRLPRELLHIVASHLGPKDLVRFGAACKVLRKVTDNRLPNALKRDVHAAIKWKSNKLLTRDELRLVVVGIHESEWQDQDGWICLSVCAVVWARHSAWAWKIKARFKNGHSEPGFMYASNDLYQTWKIPLGGGPVYASQTWRSDLSSLQFEVSCDVSGWKDNHYGSLYVVSQLPGDPDRSSSD